MGSWDFLLINTCERRPNAKEGLLRPQTFTDAALPIDRGRSGAKDISPSTSEYIYNTKPSQPPNATVYHNAKLDRVSRSHSFESN
ncbi:MAG: hypothetical protein NTW52_02820 [Planctomycetota bacterium]|nr:hypothetical protein [Planctomycetota bacterium]